MTGFVRLREAVRRRAARARRDDDSGYVLVYVLVVSMLVLGMVSTVAVTAANNVVPAQQSAYSMSATAAAESGIQAYYAGLLRANDCTSPMDLSNSSLCNPVLADPQAAPDLWTHHAITAAAGAPGFSSTNQPYYSVEVLAVTPQFVRVQSTGEVGQPGTGLHTKKVLVADISGANTSFLDYAYYSTYETVGSEQLRRLYDSANSSGADIGPTIAFDGQQGIDALKTAGVPSGAIYTGLPDTATKMTWNALPSSDSASVVGAQWCDRLYYNTTDSSGNTVLGRWQNIGALPTGYDWQRQVASGSNLAGTTQNGVCSVAFTSGTSITGPLYTRDAPLLSYGTAGGSGPAFGGPAYTAWSSDSTPSAAPPYRAFPVIGGSTAGGANSPTTANWNLSMPTWNVVASQVQNLAANPPTAPALQVCEYWGPTRIFVHDGYAYVTSPMTQADDGAANHSCYKSMADGTVASPKVPVTTTVQLAGGSTRTNTAGQFSVNQAQVPVTRTLIDVHDIGDATNWPGASSGSLLNIASGSKPAAPADPATTAALSSWSPASMQARDTFNADTNGNANWTSYSGTSSGPSFQGWLSGVVTANPDADVVSTVSDALAQYGSKNTAAKPTSSSDWRYVVTGTSPAPTTTSQSTTTAVPPTLADPLLNVTPGSSTIAKSTTTAPTTVTVAKQTATCDGTVHSGKCYQCGGLFGLGCTFGCLFWLCSPVSFTWTDPATLLSVTDTKTTVRYSQVYMAARSQFPIPDDVTQYSAWSASGNAPGDVYLEGSVAGRLSVVADDDIVITGDLSGQNATSLVAKNDVRFYHPVACLDANSSVTSPGFCPNDTTGLAAAGKLWYGSGNFDKHPSRQYVNLLKTSATDPTNTLKDVSVSAAVFAVNGAFIVDNYDRGDACGWPYSQNTVAITTSTASNCGTGTGSGFGMQSDGLGQLTVSGGVYASHHGGVGAQWPVSATAGQRPSSGYRLTIKYQVAMRDADIPYVPSAVGGNGNKPWRIVSVATALPGGSS